jgi:hypothetical protein
MLLILRYCSLVRYIYYYISSLVAMLLDDHSRCDGLLSLNCVCETTHVMNTQKDNYFII